MRLLWYHEGIVKVTVKVIVKVKVKVKVTKSWRIYVFSDDEKSFPFNKLEFIIT